jgi:hypothetical protein
MESLISGHDHVLHLAATAKPGTQKAVECRRDLRKVCGRHESAAARMMNAFTGVALVVLVDVYRVRSVESFLIALRMWKRICLSAESQFGCGKSLSADIGRMSGSAVGFEVTARRESGWGVASSSSGLRMIRSSGSALRWWNRIWLGLVISRASKAWRTRIWTVPKLSPTMYKSLSL